MFFFGCSEVNSTWLITSELANQHARKALFTCVVYTNTRYWNADMSKKRQINAGVNITRIRQKKHDFIWARVGLSPASILSPVAKHFNCRLYPCPCCTDRLSRNVKLNMSLINIVSAGSRNIHAHLKLEKAGYHFN